MAIPHSAVSTVVQKLLDDPDVAHNGMFRELMQAGLQDLVDAEATATTRRHLLPKKVSTTPGDVDLNIPKLRHGSFFPSLLSPRRRVDKALHAVICQAYIDEAVEEFLTRPLNRTWFPYVYLDATYVDVRRGGGLHNKGGRVISQAVVVATGVSAKGRREILGMTVGDAESTDLRHRVPPQPAGTRSEGRHRRRAVGCGGGDL
jgi:putative transposase